MSYDQYSVVPKVLTGAATLSGHQQGNYEDQNLAWIFRYISLKIGFFGEYCDHRRAFT